jgi:pescadillo protein
MRELAGVASVQAAQTEEQSAALKSLEPPKPQSAGNAAGQQNGKSSSGKAGAKSAAAGAANSGSKGGAAGNDDEGSEPLDIDSGSDEEDEEEVDSEAGSEDEGSEVLIDSGSDDDDEEEKEDDDDDDAAAGADGSDDEMDPVMVAARKASSQGTSTSAPSAADGALAGGILDAGVDGVQAAGGALGGGVQADDEAALCGSLFKGLVFFLSREVPREQLAFVIRWVGRWWAGSVMSLLLQCMPWVDATWLLYNIPMQYMSVCSPVLVVNG